MSTQAISDPYAAYGGHAMPPAQSTGTDPYAAYGGKSVTSAAPAQQPPTQAQQQAWSAKNSGGSISAYNPPWWERAREVVANSAIGHSLEEGLPAVADALHLHPTETVNSPTYQSDKNQLLAPQFLMPGTPQSHVGRIAQGALTGVGKLTSGNSMATTAALAATGGLAAPLAPVATGLKLGLGGTGLYGVGSDLYHAGKSYLNGDSSAGDEQLGESLPNAALMLPALAHPIESFGDAMQGSGASLENSYLKAGKKSFRYDVDPGLEMLKQGPRTSMGLTRQGIADKVGAAQNQVGASIPDIVDSSPASIPRAQLRKGADSIIQGKRDVAQGALGNLDLIPPLDALRSTISPLVDAPGNASLREVYNAKRNADENINWGRDLDPKDATVNNARREIRSNFAGQIYDAEPELEEPSQQYAGLSVAAKLAKDRTYDRNGSIFNPLRIMSMFGSGALAEGATHQPGLSTVVGLTTGALPEIAKLPIVKTGAATGLYQAGRAVSAVGRGLSFPTFGRPVPFEEGTPNSPDAHPQQNANEGQSQSAPPSGAYRSTSVTPEIIRPDAVSRSKFGLGATGRAGTMVRPIAALPAPVIPPPEATPYSFVNRQPLTAIPARAPEALANSVGSKAYTLPDSVLGDLFEGNGTEAQKAAALRQANLGSYGGLVPQRLLEPPSSLSTSQVDMPKPPAKFQGLRRKR